MPSLPHRFSEKAFRRYEKIISQVVAKYPTAIVIDPSSLGLSGETVRGRLRDAIDSYAEHSWASAIVDQAKFQLEIKESKNILVSLRPNGFVLVGTKEAIDSLTDEEKEGKGKDKAEVNYLNGEHIDLTHFSSETILGIVAFIAHNGGLKKKVKIRASTSTIEKLKDMYDIGHEPGSSDNEHLIS